MDGFASLMYPIDLAAMPDCSLYFDLVSEAVGVSHAGNIPVVGIPDNELFCWILYTQNLHSRKHNGHSGVSFEPSRICVVNHPTVIRFASETVWQLLKNTQGSISETGVS